MSNQKKKINIFLASPGDLEDERLIAKQVVEGLKAKYSQDNLEIELLGWENVSPDAGRPQSVILSQTYPDSWMIFVGILWLRFGSETGEVNSTTGKSFLSGTEEEFKKAYDLRKSGNKGWPKVIIYRCMRLPISLEKIDSEQFSRVEDFFNEFGPSGQHPALYSKFVDSDEFEEKIVADLDRYIKEYLEDHADEYPKETNQSNPNVNASLIVKQMEQKLLAQTDPNLLSSLVSNTSAPKDLLSVFVPPPIYSVSEHRYRALNETEKKLNPRLAVDDLLDIDNNLLLIGKKESGKTTTLKYLLSKMVESDDYSKIPLIIDLGTLPKGQRKIERAIASDLARHEINMDVNSILQDSDWVLFVDNFGSHDKPAQRALRNFITTYPDARYVLSVDEDAFEELNLPKNWGLSIDFDKVYIHSFKRKEVRELTEKWFKDSSVIVQAGEVADEILRNVLKINMPRTPFVISMMLLSIEQNREYSPLNKAALVENILDLLLEKLEPNVLLQYGIDYRNLEDLLAFLAHGLTIQKTKSITQTEMREMFEEYFEVKGLEFEKSVDFIIEYLIERGVLSRYEGNLSFRFLGFYEFFVAKRMLEDEEFYNFVLSEARYLEFANSLDYITGLNRKNKALVQLLGERVQKNMDKLKDDMGITSFSLGFFDDIHFSTQLSSSLSNLEREEMVAKLRESKINEEIKDNMYDLASTFRDDLEKIEQVDSQDRIGNSNDDEEDDPIMEGIYKTFVSTYIYANAIKNCELINDRAFKRDSLDHCTKVILQVIYVVLLSSENGMNEIDLDDITGALKDVSGTEEEDIDIDLDELREQINSWYRGIVFLVVQSIFSSQLGNRKLGRIIEEALEQNDLTMVEELFYTILYSDTGLRNYLDKFDSFVNKSIENSFFRDIIFRKLSMDYSMKNLSDKEANRLEQMIANIIIKDRGYSKKQKSSIIGSTKKQRYNRSAEE